MSRARVRRTSTAAAAAIAAAALLGGVFAPAPAHAGLAVNLQFASGNTTMLIGGDQTNTDIPIQVWATVTGANALSPVPTPGTSSTAPTQSGNFDGLQYLYYNLLNSNGTTTEIAGGVDTAVLNATLGFNANGSQVGVISNTANGISVGSNSSTGSIAKPRAAAAVFDNYATFNQSTGMYQEIGGDNKNIKLGADGKSVSFLVETINFKPTAYSPLNKTTFTVQIPTAAQLSPNSTLAQANWFQDTTSQNLGTGTMPTPTASNMDGSPTAGSQVVIEDTLQGDTNLDGTVNGTDLGNLAANFGKASGATFAQGDFNGDKAVNGTDLGDLAANFGKSIGGVTPSSETFSQALAEAEVAYPSFADAIGSSAVPEPASISVVALIGVGLLSRRRTGAEASKL